MTNKLMEERFKNLPDLNKTTNQEVKIYHRKRKELMDRITLLLPPELKKEFQDYLNNNNYSAYEILCPIIRDFLDQQKKQKSSNSFISSKQSP
jgi:hypothetical protein